MGRKKGEVTRCEHKESHHLALGLCRSCYHKEWKNRDIEKHRKRHRENVRRWRKLNPIRESRHLAKSHLKKLEPSEIEALVKEIMEEMKNVKKKRV